MATPLRCDEAGCWANKGTQRGFCQCLNEKALDAFGECKFKKPFANKPKGDAPNEIRLKHANDQLNYIFGMFKDRGWEAKSKTITRLVLYRPLEDGAIHILDLLDAYTYPESGVSVESYISDSGEYTSYPLSIEDMGLCVRYANALKEIWKAKGGY